jgi:hypothetical protein
LKIEKHVLGILVLLGLVAAPFGRAQDQGVQGGKPADRMQGPAAGPEVRQRPLAGKITAIGSDTLEIAKPNGDTVKVKLSDKTVYRKDREAGKLSDFKVGDFVLVRGEENEDHSVNAQLIATRTGGPGGPMGTLGKDFVLGEVKAIDAPRLTVLRVDNVSQTLELNEETSLRKGRESITMADIQPGDHVVVRGAEENGVFVPKFVMVIGPEQWKRMEQMGMIQMRAEGGKKPAGDAPPQAKPQEQQN